MKSFCIMHFQYHMAQKMHIGKESAKLRALHALVPYMLPCTTRLAPYVLPCPIFSHALRAPVPHVVGAPRALVT